MESPDELDNLMNDLCGGKEDGSALIEVGDGSVHVPIAVIIHELERKYARAYPSPSAAAEHWAPDLWDDDTVGVMIRRVEDVLGGSEKCEELLGKNWQRLCGEGGANHT